MKKIMLCTWGCLLLCASLAVMADDTRSSLTQSSLLASPWELTRQTGLGSVKTVWVFNADGTGSARQTVTRNNNKEELQHSFTYTVDADRVIVQEDIAEEWEGHFGVTRWTLQNGELVHDHNFRQDRIIFRPVK